MGERSGSKSESIGSGFKVRCGAEVTGELLSRASSSSQKVIV